MVEPINVLKHLLFPLQTSREMRTAIICTKKWYVEVSPPTIFFLFFFLLISVDFTLFQLSGDANQSVAFKLEQLTKLIYSIEDKVTLFFIFG